MASIFNLTIPQLRQWSRRQVTDHRQLNEPVEALNRMTTGVGVPRQTVGVPVAATGIAFAVVDSLAEEEDVLFVKYLDQDNIPASQAESAMVWPNMINTDWRTFVDTDIVVPVVLSNGIPYVMQLPRWYMRDDPSGIPGGDCRI